MYQNNSTLFTIICHVFGLWRGQCNVVHWIDLGIDLDALNHSPQFLKCYLFVIELKYLFFIVTHFLQFIKSLIVLWTVLFHCEPDMIHEDNSTGLFNMNVIYLLNTEKQYPSA